MPESTFWYKKRMVVLERDAGRWGATIWDGTREIPSSGLTYRRYLDAVDDAKIAILEDLEEYDDDD